MEITDLPLGERIQRRREEMGMTRAELAQRSHVDKGHVTRIESGERRNPRPEILKRIATALEMPMSDLLIDYLDADDVPSLTPYLRTRYHDLPKAAERELQESFRRITAKYGYDANEGGPSAGEDET